MAMFFEIMRELLKLVLKRGAAAAEKWHRAAGLAFRFQVCLFG